MNAFLAGLLDRAEGRSPVLERRPRALFEPRSASELRPIESLEQNETVVSEPRSGQRMSVSDVRGQEQRSEWRPRGERLEQSRNSVPVAMPESRPSELSRPEPRGELMPVDHDRVRARALPASADESPSWATRSSSVVERHQSLVTVTKLVDARHAQETKPAPPEPRENAPKLTSENRRGADASPVVSQTTVVVERPQRIAALTPRPTLRVAAESAVRLAHAQGPAATRQEQHAVTPAPVQITIGRVEVRAVSEKRERSQARGPAAPRLSLDAYLRQRGGAAR